MPPQEDRTCLLNNGRLTIKGVDKMEKIKVVMVEPNEEARIVEINSSLKDMQEAVGGYIETYEPFEEEAVIVCNEEGKINGMPMNRVIKDKDGNVRDLICGPFFICYAPFESESFLSLSDEMAEKYKEMFKTPEMFVKTENGLAVIPMA